MSQSAQHLPNSPFSFKVVSGPDVGTRFPLDKATLFIGRGPDNDIVLNDARCSRQHIKITFTKQGILMKDAGSSTGVTVNGQAVRECILGPGAVVMIGDSQLRLDSTAQKSVPVAVATGQPPLSTQGVPPPPASNRQGVERLNPQAASSSGSPITLFFLVIIIGGGAYYYLQNRAANEAQVDSIRSPEMIDEDIAETKRRTESLIRLQNEKGKDTQQYRDAQAAFIKGFRDYREGQYRRAMFSFSAALSLYPDHAMAQRYYQISQRKLDELVQYSMLEAKRFFEKNQFQSAAASYKQVMIYLEDPNNKTYQEARERLYEIQVLLKGAF